MKQGIYIWRNLITGTVLVGQTQNFRSRKGSYLNALKNKTYRNQYFQRSWDKYGKENFLFEIIEIIENPILLTSYEQSYLNYYRTLPGGVYNLIGPVDNPRRGMKASEETKKKQSDALKRYHSKIGHSKETKEKMSRTRLGKKHIKKHPPCPEHVKNIVSKIHTGKVVSLETREKLSANWKGRKHSEEAKEKMRQAHKERHQKKLDDMID